MVTNYISLDLLNVFIEALAFYHTYNKKNLKITKLDLIII